MSILKNLLIFFIIFFSSLTNAEIIKKIDLIGLDTISRGTVLNYLPVEVGDDFNEIIAKDSIDKLYKTDFFYDITINFKEDVLKINFVENPTIKFFDFKNFKEDDVLNEEMINNLKSNFNFGIGNILVKKNLETLLKELERLYKFNAYYDAKFEIKSYLDSKNRIGIEVLISEGEQALINSFKFHGNEKFDDSSLLENFDIGEADFFLINFFTEKDKFSKLKFDAGIEKTSSFYYSLGYLDFKIINKEVKYNKDLKIIDIDIFVDEGKQYQVKSITFEGKLLDTNKDVLRGMIDVSDGDFFERSKIIKGIQKITDFYKNNGYAFAKIDSKANQLGDSNLVDISILVDPGALVYIDRINIEGNFRTQDDVIRREIKVLESDVYSKESLDESVSNIKRLGYFTDVNYDLKQHNENSDKSDLLIDVSETKTGEFSIGLSHSNSTGAALNASISQKNILGTGNTLKAAFSNSDAVEELSVYFLDPYINNKGHSISYGFFDKTLNAANIDASSYIINESGFNFGYGIPVSENSSVFSEIKTTAIDLSCGLDLKNIYETSECSSNDDLDVNFSIKYSSNTLNDFYFPTEGSSNLLSGSIGLPFADQKYLNLSSKFKYYRPIFNDKTLKFSSKVDAGFGYGGDSLPFYKRYYGGGASSIRGFDFNSLGPKYANDKPKGGEFSFVTSLGVASGVEFLGIDNKNMRLIGFVDAGSVSNKVSEFETTDVRSSFGLQFSWLTPIGPIGLNFAQPLIKKSYDKTETFAFELGSTF